MRSAEYKTGELPAIPQSAFRIPHLNSMTTSQRVLTADMVQAMRPGSVIVDMAIESGGNVEGAKVLPADYLNMDDLLSHRGVIMSVDALRRDGLVIASLVADDNGVVVGHILFSRLFIHGDTSKILAVALAPMAVVPGRQRCGIGSMLIRGGLDTCRRLGERIVLVVGHPSYYPRFGFSHALTSNLRSPYDGEAFMALELRAGAGHYLVEGFLLGWIKLDWRQLLPAAVPVELF